MNRIYAGIAALLTLTGCKMGPMGPYISPLITGRAVAADSGKGLAGVTVTRGKPDHGLANQAKGAELMVMKLPALTDRDGRFTLPSERVLSVFRGSGWAQARLTFAAPGYETLVTNYSTLAATNTPAGEPVLDLGVIRLERTRR